MMSTHPLIFQTLRQSLTGKTAAGKAHFNQVLHEKLLHSDLLSAYQHAFRTATGLPLHFMKPDIGANSICELGENSSRFCEKLNLRNPACQSCIEANRRLMEDAKVNGPTTYNCFTGMATTAVPVSCKGALIGTLRTGQVFRKKPGPENFKMVTKSLSRQGLTEDGIQALHDAYIETHVIEPERYQSMVNLLSIFASQLEEHAQNLQIHQ